MDGEEVVIEYLLDGVCDVFDLLVVGWGEVR